MSGTQPRGVSSDFLRRVWNFFGNQASTAIERNTQLNRKSNDSTLSKQFSTNDRILRYRRIKSEFVTDTMFVTKAAQSTRGNTMLKLFVSDKGFIDVYNGEEVRVL
mmetsp:Transcript_28152/g.26982  ORF Transcript_28152/g.26982 Transcript_28152/m.26982 type:complete len:106 (-) Transcript_28152:830-1147(-)